jgi:hypothetical protein
LERLVAKKVLDGLGKVMLINGAASVRHERASDPYKNLQKEAPGVYLNDHLWEHMPSANTITDQMINTYMVVTDAAAKFFDEHDPAYAAKFIKDRDEWLALFNA